MRHNIPIICVVNNDCAWGMIKHSREMSIGEERERRGILNIRFLAVARNDSRDRF
ncbi:MAG TPA: thiamine pyrophosphate-dependent enzyme [Desulfosalsimonadaceae bacterium]|nr:thiamine pyrophosphate-dependent enzyme [Desulfosalsimonadaceae bacterium]